MVGGGSQVIGALVYLILRGVPYVDEARVRRDAEWRRTAPPANLNYQQVFK